MENLCVRQFTQEAVRLKEGKIATEVLAVSIGPQNAQVSPHGSCLGYKDSHMAELLSWDGRCIAHANMHESDTKDEDVAVDAH